MLPKLFCPTVRKNSPFLHNAHPVQFEKKNHPKSLKIVEDMDAPSEDGL